MSAPVYDVIVIGGGPAGLAAAETAATGGARTLLVDGGPELGGHYYKRLPPGFAGPLGPADRDHARELQAHIYRLERRQVEVRQAQVWGVFNGTEAAFDGEQARRGLPSSEETHYSVYLDNGQGSHSAAEGRSLILAPGVYDRPLPFPGWTLPGALTPGAVQMLMKRQGLLPGERLLVAGSGPLQLAIAANLAQAGAQVVALLDLCAPAEGAAQFPAAMWGQWERLGEFAGYVWALLKHRVPLLFHYGVRRALGSPEDGVTAVEIGPVDAEGRPTGAPTRTLEVDSVVSAHGFLPAINLSLHLGCEHEYLPQIGGYIPRHDSRLETSQPNVFVAGDVTGAGGKPLATLQGRIAALSALENLGILEAKGAQAQRTALAPAVRREARFARLLWERYRFRPGALEDLPPETIICRCEGVTLQDLQASFEAGGRTIAGTKLRTRLGMGICQGRYCLINGAALLAGMGMLPVPEVGLMRIRPPVMPVRIETLAYYEEVL